MLDILSLCKKAKEAFKDLAYVKTEEKNKALVKMAEALQQNVDDIKDANKKDIDSGKKKGLSKALLDRLMLDDKRIEAMAQGLLDIAKLPDPVGAGEIFKRPNGLNIMEQNVPMGVIGIIYEARPNVTSDAAGLCIKSGNCVILRGGSEAINSNIAIVKALKQGLKEAGMSEGVIQLIEDTSRESVNILMQMKDYVDLLIPRGGAGLIKAITENSKVPVIVTGEGNCHIYVDADADLDMAKDIVINAKISRPSVCNAVETLLVHESIADKFLPLVLDELREKGVEIRGCKKTCKIYSDAKKAEDNDWRTEYLDLVIAVKVIDGVDEAIEHINKYGTKHSEAIITKDYSNSRKFLSRVDAACVYVNASTRFTDGGEFGFGAEMGISTQKLHARGPMGLRELTCKKYIILGEGQVRN